jgi:transposase-like protein
LLGNRCLVSVFVVRYSLFGIRCGHAQKRLTFKELTVNSQKDAFLRMKKKQEFRALTESRGGQRYFSPDVRKAIVKEIDAGLSLAEATRKYEVSRSGIYKWMALYSTSYKKGLVTVVEEVSMTNKVAKLQAELEKVYSLLGQSQAKNIYLEELINVANEHFETDLKKNLETRHSLGKNKPKGE